MSPRYRLALFTCSLLFSCLLFAFVTASAQLPPDPDDVAWDHRWAQAGVDGEVLALARNGDSLFVGGNFTKDFGEEDYGSLLMLDLSDSSWHDIGFRPLGANVRVNALEFDSATATLYVGGQFSGWNGDPPIGYFAKWKNGTWSTISGGDDDFNQIVYDIEIVRETSGGPPEVIVGGMFTSVAGIEAKGVARYRGGFGWDNMGANLERFGVSSNPVIYALDYRLGRLWVGGAIEIVGVDSTVEGLVSYSYSQDEWQSANGGITNGSIYSLEAFGDASFYDRVVVGGSFYQLNGESIDTDILVYNSSTEEWSELGAGLNGPVYRLEARQTGANEEIIYAGGGFRTSGSDTVNYIAFWLTSDSSWHDFEGGVNSVVRDFTSPLQSATVLVGGNFSLTAPNSFQGSDSVVVNGVAMNDVLGDWHGFGLGPDGTVIYDAFVTDSGAMYLVGNFTEMFNRRLTKIVKIDDSVQQVPGYFRYTPEFIAVNGDTIYVARDDILEIDSVTYNYIAMYNGSQWQSLAGGVNHRVRDIALGPDGTLYVAGYFDTIGGTIPSQGIASWDGSQWTNIPANIQDDFGQDYAEKVAVDPLSGDLYISGSFETVDGLESRAVARWDGANWHALGPVGVPLNPNFYIPTAITIDGAGRVFVAMDAYRDGGENFQVWVWDGGSWFLAGDQILCFHVRDMVSDGCNVWATGSGVNGITSSCDWVNIARFNGSGWDQLGNGISGTVEQLVLTDSELYAVGTIRRAGASPSWNIAAWTDLPGAAGAFAISPVAPTAGDTLQYGTAYPIQFSASGVELVQAEYSLDSGQTWSIIHNRAEPGRDLVWLVPDTNAAYCQLRFANAAAACEFEYGPFFTIVADSLLESTWLTHKAGTYYREPFLPGYNSFSFGNNRGRMWPDSVADSINYAGFPEPPDSVENFPDWYLYCEAYGSDWCYKNGDPDRIRPKALNHWQGLLRDWGGSCLGMSTASLLWLYGVTFNTGLIIPYQPLYELGYIPLTRDAGNKHWIYQNGVKHIKHDKDAQVLTPFETMDIIRDDFFADFPRTLSFSYRSWQDKLDDDSVVVDSNWDSRGHNVVPYRVVNVPDTPGVYYMHYYDPNAPTDTTRWVRIDSVDNTWFMPNYYSADTNSRFIPRLPINEYIGLADDDRVTTGLKRNASSHPAIVYTSATEEVLISDGVGGELGWVDNNPVITGIDGIPILPDDPDYQYPYPGAYLLPDGAYSLSLSNFEGDDTRLFWFSDSTSYAYKRQQPDSTQEDRLTIGDGLSVVNPDTAAKTASLTTIVTHGTAERLIELSGLSLAQNDSTNVSVDSSGAITVWNTGSAKEYSLILWNSDGAMPKDEITQSLAPVAIGANATQRIEPAWGTLGANPTVILTDSEQDGLFEDTSVIAVVTDVEDDEDTSLLPEGYQLAQNYPNPFNPTTTIEFSLPKATRVRLDIYNVLGQRVTTLVNKELAAGDYAVDWNGRNAGGSAVASGVYFYRLIADDFSKAKKMLLLK